MIRCKDLSKAYGGHRVLDAVNLEIDAGICAVLGPNGAGKSTLLRMMAGLEAPDAGSIEMAGLDMASDGRRAKQLIGVLPDQLGLFDSLTVSENLRCVGPVYGLSAGETQMRAESLLALLDLAGAQHTLAGDCSYGMRKKTALALALLHAPRVLVLDEPFEGIDPSSSRVIERTLRVAAAGGVTVLMTSHILPLVERLASRVVVLRGGVVAWDSAEHARDGSLEELYFGLIGEPVEGGLPWLG
jgi:ABC-2 type transport system ATP-binding protein